MSEGKTAHGAAQIRLRGRIVGLRYFVMTFSGVKWRPKRASGRLAMALRSAEALDPTRIYAEMVVDMETIREYEEETGGATLYEGMILVGTPDPGARDMIALG